MAWGPSRSMIVRHRAAISPSASSPEIRSQRPAPLPLRPGAAQRRQEPSGGARVLEVAVHFLAQGAARIGVLAVAQELDRPAVLHGDDPATGVGAGEGADAAGPRGR